MSNGIEQLSEVWNRVGRSYARACEDLLDAFHSGRSETVDLPRDPRSQDLALEVLTEVVRLNEAGRWREARGLFDPAHEPFIPEMEKTNKGLPFAVILGPDEFLVRHGSVYQEGRMLHIQGETVACLPEMTAAAVSEDREMVALAHPKDGVEVRRGLGGEQIASFPWPSDGMLLPTGLPSDLREVFVCADEPPRLEALCVSDDGLRIAIADPNRGVLVGSRRESDPLWRLVYPSVDEPFRFDELARELWDDARDEPLSFGADMLHAALSRDGRYLAFGEQCSSHYLFDIDASKDAAVVSEIGPKSEYPHCACFGDDGQIVAFNSCHFYNGATFAARVDGVRGAQIEAWTDDPRTRMINNYLRVYAAAWLPPALARGKPGAFLLGGSSVATAVTPDGTVLWELLFGSSASSVDVCPKSRRIVIGSYSGMLHILDTEQLEESGRAIAWRAPREVKRWIFWDTLEAPIQW